MRILIKDDTIGGETENSFTIEIGAEYVTVDELIKARIYEEVNRYNEKLPEYFRSLVQPTNTEITLNGYKRLDNKKLDAEKQYYLALEAFQQNVFFLLVNDKQVDSLTEKIRMKDNMELNFIKLTPLVGG